MHTTSPDFTAYDFETLDAYTGPEEKRAEWLAWQFTSYGDDVSADEFDGLLTDAYAVIAAWRLSRLDASLAAVSDAMERLAS